MLNSKTLSLLQFLLIIGLAMLYPSLGFSAGSDPLNLVNDNLSKGVSTFQLIALTIAGVALIVTALAGAFGRLDVNRMLQIFAAIILIAGATMFISWIAGLVK
ncbi:MAG: TrbC/VirB2 family protein [Alphaproteobacteria bacterium]|jgi:type IV secretory pathway VirB2 component (pilin)|nr:TrbC/VirB2 family protein [Alphaproteobacteria bacterium]